MVIGHAAVPPEPEGDMNQTLWESIIHHWPMTLFVPGIVAVLAGLAVITRMVDRD